MTLLLSCKIRIAFMLGRSTLDPRPCITVCCKFHRLACLSPCVTYLTCFHKLMRFPQHVPTLSVDDVLCRCIPGNSYNLMLHCNVQTEHIQVLLKPRTAMCVIRQGSVDWVSAFQFRRLHLSRVSRCTVKSWEAKGEWYRAIELVCRAEHWLIERHEVECGRMCVKLEPCVCSHELYHCHLQIRNVTATLI